MSDKGRVLVVDDDHALVRIAQSVLQKQGFDVLTAFDGLEGLQKAQQEKPDVIVLDITMPKMDGYEVCRRLQQDPSTRQIPVVFLTAKGQDKERTTYRDRLTFTGDRDAARGFEAGAMEFLTKPVTAKDLVQKVEGLLWFSKL